MRTFPTEAPFAALVPLLQAPPKVNRATTKATTAGTVSAPTVDAAAAAADTAELHDAAEDSDDDGDDVNQGMDMGIGPKASPGGLPGLDEEVSFFTNAYHLQWHRRARALRRARLHLAAGTVSAASAPVAGVLLPYLWRTLTLPDHTGKHAPVIDEAVQTFRVAAQQMPWTAYVAAFRHAIKLMELNPASERPLLRAVVAMVDAFHFSLTAPLGADATDAQRSLAGRMRTTVERVMLPTLRGLLVEGDRQSGATTDYALSSQMTGPDGETSEGRRPTAVRAPVALACVRLLQELPQALMEEHLPGLLITLARLLRSRNGLVRDSVRATLVGIVTRLGPAYLPFILRELEASLQHGYQRHILTYTLHALLEALVGPKPADGATAAPATTTATPALDASVPLAMQFIVGELFGDVGAEKDEAAVVAAQGRETRARRGADALELLARGCSIAALPDLFQPLVDQLAGSLRPAYDRPRVEEALRRLGLGLVAAPLLAPADLLLMVHALLTGEAPFVALPGATATTVAGPSGGGAPRGGGRTLLLAPTASASTSAWVGSTAPTRSVRAALARPSNSWTPHAHILPQCALHILLAAFKRSRFDTSNPEQLALLAPVPRALADALTSKQERVVVGALRALTQLAPLPIEAAPATAAGKRGAFSPALEKQLVERVFELLESTAAGAVASDLVQGCFRLLSTLLRPGPASVPANAVSSAQLARLAIMLRPELSGGATEAATATTFTLVRAIIGRGWLAPELYDLMDAVAEALVQAQTAPVRASARTVFVAYLLTCPMGPARLQGHLAFLVRQLAEYEMESGRQAALEALAALVEQLPEPTVLEHALFLLVGMAAVLVHDTAPTIRAGTATVLKALLGRLDAKRMDDAWVLLKRWWQLGATDASLARTAAQVATLLLEAQPPNVWTPYVPGLLAQLERVLSPLAVAAAAEGSSSDGGGDGATGQAADDAQWLREPLAAVAEVESQSWEVLYYTVTLATRALGTLPALWDHDRATAAAVGHVLEGGAVLLAHPHAWVQRAADRLMGVAFGKLDMASLRLDGEPSGAVVSTAAAAAAAATSSKKARLSGRPAAPVDRGFVFGRPARLLGIARAFLVQLASQHLDAEACDQLAKNLFFLGRCLQLHPGVRPPHQAARETAADDDDDDDDDDGGGGGDNDDMDDQATAVSGQSTVAAVAPGLRWLCSRLIYRVGKGPFTSTAHLLQVRCGAFAGAPASHRGVSARDRGCVRPVERGGRCGHGRMQQGLVFRWFAGMATILPVTATVELLPEMLRALMRALETTAARPGQAELSTSPTVAACPPPPPKKKGSGSLLTRWSGWAGGCVRLLSRRAVLGARGDGHAQGDRGSDGVPGGLPAGARRDPANPLGAQAQARI